MAVYLERNVSRLAQRSVTKFLDLGISGLGFRVMGWTAKVVLLVGELGFRF